MSTASDRIKLIQAAIEVDGNGNPLKVDGIAGPATKAAAAILFGTPSTTQWPTAAPVAGQVPQRVLIVGDDSVEPISSKWIALMKTLTGKLPDWVGRYIGPERAATYQLLKSEIAIAAANGIRFVLVAEQTPRVGGTYAEGFSDGQGNVENAKALFGVDPAIIYLDVEGSPSTGSPSLSEDYWQGWVKGIGGVLPGIYASENDGVTWKAVSNSEKLGVKCASAWIASYLTVKANKLPILPAWDATRARMNTGDSTPSPSCPVDIWQYAGGFDGTDYEALDPDSLNPATDPAAFLARCVSPVA